ncbi:hypothetical protein [Dyadobacter sp. 676]|uniref:Uncharacterized protein n=1 Tax=Dyadobacter sp. 676 TaxID=3088362 RepID=A0AAU8FJ73_9BACT
MRLFGFRAIEYMHVHIDKQQHRAFHILNGKKINKLLTISKFDNPDLAVYLH